MDTNQPLRFFPLDDYQDLFGKVLLRKDTLICFDPEAGKVSVSGQEFPAYRRGYDLVVGERVGGWKQMRVRVVVEPEYLAELHAQVLAVEGMREGSREVRILTDKGTIRLTHEQECCEQVLLRDLTGDPEDLEEGIIVVFECRVGPLKTGDVGKRPLRSHQAPNYTFYEIRTTKGDVTMRWGENEISSYGTQVHVAFDPA
jgi:hypothetical protein